MYMNMYMPVHNLLNLQNLLVLAPKVHIQGTCNRDHTRKERLMYEHKVQVGIPHA